MATGAFDLENRGGGHLNGRALLDVGDGRRDLHRLGGCSRHVLLVLLLNLRLMVKLNHSGQFGRAEDRLLGRLRASVAGQVGGVCEYR